MSSSEIAKLETRWQENPQGLTFAPLAEAYRKLREPQRALEILAVGLARHPDYIPASIVLGRCHLDLGDTGQAAGAFQRVLALDDENVIALKALADIAEKHGRYDEAQDRLRVLLAVDRSNDEARAQLERIEEALAAGPPVEPVTSEVASPEPVEASIEAPMDAEAEITVDAGAEPAADDMTEAMADAAAEPVADAASEPPAAGAGEALFQTEAEPLRPEDFSWEEHESGIELEDNFVPPVDVQPLPDMVVDDLPRIDSETAGAAPLGGLVGEDFREHSAAVTPLSDLSPGSASIGEPIPPGEHAEPLAGIEPEDGMELDTGIELDREIELHPAGATEFQVESATDELAARSADLELGDAELDRGAGDLADFGELSEEAASLPATPGPVLTESIAEIYLEQGHREEALRVYRALYERNRDDLRLREKVDELETALAEAESEAEFEPMAPATSAASPAPERGQTVAAFLAGILAARPAGAAAWSPASGEARPLSPDAGSNGADAAPTRPAADHLSLSAVFGDTGSPVPPAVPAGTTSADDEGISFDAFFGSEAASTPTKARGASRDDDDLDQFHSWLQNLKR